MDSKWSSLPLGERIAWCRRFRGALVDHRASLVERMGEEVQKSTFEALTGDLLVLLASLRWHERHARRVLRTRRVRGAPIWMPGVRTRVERVPVGRLAIIATWNYPAQLLGIQLVQALLAGNRVVVKPSEHAPRTQRMLLELASRSLPVDFSSEDRGATVAWTEATREAGAALIESERWDHVVFTGSTRVGASIAERAGAGLIPTTLELSGCDSAIVLGSSDVDLAARSIWNAVVLNAGQTCMAPRRVLVDRRVEGALTAAFEWLAEAGEARALIDERALDAAERCVLEAGERGARIVPSNPIDRSSGTIRPVLLGGCPAETSAARGEHFAPILAVVGVDSADEALEIHHRGRQHLATSIFGDRAEAEAIAKRLRTSSVITINDALLPTGHPGVAIAGVDDSGWHPSRGAEGLLAMTRGVAVSVSSRRVRAPRAMTRAEQDKLVSKMDAFVRWWYRPIGVGREAMASEAGDQTGATYRVGGGASRRSPDSAGGRAKNAPASGDRPDASGGASSAKPDRSVRSNRPDEGERACGTSEHKATTR